MICSKCKKAEATSTSYCTPCMKSYMKEWKEREFVKKKLVRQRQAKKKEVKEFREWKKNVLSVKK